MVFVTVLLCSACPSVPVTVRIRFAMRWTLSSNRVPVPRCYKYVPRCYMYIYMYDSASMDFSALSSCTCVALRI